MKNLLSKLVMAALLLIFSAGISSVAYAYDMPTVEEYGALYGAIDINAVKTESSGISFPKIPEPLATFLMFLGMLFIILIAVAIIVIIVKYLSGGFGKQAAGSAGSVSQAALAPAGDQNLVNDAELVAAITAAIMAYESENHVPGGLVVRSIQRRR